MARVHSTNSDCLWNEVFVALPNFGGQSNVRAHARARKMSGRSETLLARRGEARCSSPVDKTASKRGSYTRMQARELAHAHRGEFASLLPFGHVRIVYHAGPMNEHVIWASQCHRKRPRLDP